MVKTADETQCQCTDCMFKRLIAKEQQSNKSNPIKGEK